ncbi:MAG TPA: tryptophan-rich sensory protein [Ignavibacteria bacterium]|nr:TspO protein [Bacteroidota bacterium]HRI86042.1 tryptophan-rich sensory protein [Ignavibacteria bacterium]HRK00867.1 tryptophan-rich sensory protein [Ignavibacteria bacterium]
MSNFIKLLVSIIICQMAGFIGTIFTSDSLTGWYAGLTKPDFNPPNWIFGPVWILLYFMMGISLFLVWREDLKNAVVKKAFYVFMIQLIFNASWSIVFFGFQSVTGALIIIIIFWLLIIYTILNFLKVSRTSGILLIPYLLWVSFAAILNFFIFKLN